MPMSPQEVRAFNESVINEFRAGGGRITDERLQDAHLLLLTTVGARSGRPHTTPLAYFPDGPDRVVLWASAMAAPSHPAWYHNLIVNPKVTLEIRTGAGTVETVDTTASTAEGAERERLLGLLRAEHPEIAAHQDRTEREIPLVVIELPAR